MPTPGDPRESPGELRCDALTVPLHSPGESDTARGGDTRRAACRLEFARGPLDLTRRFAIMGIVNRTPDSFYDRGATFGLDEALGHARAMARDGADIIDVGGVKGGPGVEVTVDDELERIVPFVEALRAVDERVLVSVDTFRAPVADAALAAGADIVNDVTGLHDEALLGVVARHDAGYVAMHHGGRPRTRPFRRHYLPDVTSAVVAHCRELTRRAIAAGIDPARLIVDPGHDFQKTTAHSLELSRRLPELAALGFPVLVALSNKDFLGETLGRPLDERVDASIAAAVFNVLRGANIVRVHEVARTADALRMTEALLGWREATTNVRGLA